MDKFLGLVLLVVSSLLLVGITQEASAAWVLDFATMSHGDIVNTQFSAQIPGAPTGLGVTIYADNFQQGTNTVSSPAITEPPVLPNIGNIDANDLAVVFDSGSGDTSGGDPDLLAPFTDGFGSTPGTEPKLLIIQENPGDCNATTCSPPDDQGSAPAGQFIFVFSRPTIIDTVQFFDIEAAEQTPSDTEILMFDNSNNLINALPVPRLQVPVTGDNGHDVVNVKVGKVKTLVVEMRGSGAISLIGGDDPVGGQVLSIDNTALLITDTQNNSYSVLTAFTMIAAGAFGFLYYTSKKKQ